MLCTSDAVFQAFISVLDAEMPEEAIPFAVAAQADFLAGTGAADDTGLNT